MLSIQYSLYMSIQHNEHDVYIIYLFNCSCDISIGWCFHSRIEHLVSPVCNFWRWPRQSVLVRMSYWCDGDDTKRLETQWRSVWTRTWETKTEVLRSIPKAVLASFDCFWVPNIGLSYSWIFIYLGTQLHKETYWNRSWPGSTAHEFRFASIPRWQSWGWPSRVRLTPVKLQAWPGRWGRHWYFDIF